MAPVPRWKMTRGKVLKLQSDHLASLRPADDEVVEMLLEGDLAN